jgi:hypothetical protein
MAAVIYYTKTSQSLPSFMPGRRQGVLGHDTTRGIAAIFAAVLALLIAGVSLGTSRIRRR